jgi:hypothetical protein
MSDFVPPSPTSVTLRPLTKGMVSNSIGTDVPEGGALRVRNMLVQPTGPQRRPAWAPAFGDKTSYGRIDDLEEDEIIQDVIPFWSIDGSFRYLAISNKCLRSLGASDYTWQRVPYLSDWQAPTSASSTELELTGETFLTDGVRAGDIIQYRQGVAGGLGYAMLPGAYWPTGYWLVSADEGSVTITSVAEDTLTYDTNAGIVDCLEFQVQRVFAIVGSGSFVDYTVTPSYLVLTDGSAGGLVKYDGNVMSALGQHAASGDADPDYLQGARTVLYFAGMLWLGGTIEADASGEKFVRWSSLTDLTEFAAVDYAAFSREDSGVLKLSCNEDVPIVYLENAIYTGYASSLEGLPFAFVRVEAGPISLAGPRAQVSARGGQFFIASDNFYFLATGREGSGQTVSCEPIATSIINEASDIAPSLLRAQVVYDKKREAVYFVLPTSDSRIWRTFVLCLRTKAWSYYDTPAATFVALCVIPQVFSSTTWNDLTGLTWADLVGRAWDSMRTIVGMASVCAIDLNGALYGMNDAATDDMLIVGDEASLTQFAISIEYVTGDLDFDAPDVDKVVTRVAVHVGDVGNVVREIDANVAIELSDTKGRVWVAKGIATIEPESDADEVHFRFRSDHPRIKLTCERTPPLALTGVMVRVRPGELHNVRGV